MFLLVVFNEKRLGKNQEECISEKKWEHILIDERKQVSNE